MAKKKFKTESQKLLDMMINSIYTNREIFLRELISNASDAIDKLYFRSLTDDSVKLKKDDYEIRLTVNKDARTISIKDNGCGMTEEELDKNLGTIAKSGSFDFKNEDGSAKDQVDIIGQFGVGFYSAFMVADSITVESKAFGADGAFRWSSSGIDGYSIDPCDKAENGTIVTLHLKDDTDDDKYGDFLEQSRISNLVKKFSDYIRYPIRMQMTSTGKKNEETGEYETVIEDRTLNSMIPIWKKNAKEVTEEEYADFYKDNFCSYMSFGNPLATIRQKSEGTFSYEALMFIPETAPHDYYTRDYEKGLRLYSSGVMIMNKCADLLPDYFSFVKGIVDSPDLSLNISREILQQNRQLKAIAKGIEKKIHSELVKMLENDREKYEKFFKAFGTQLKFGIYSDYGMHRDVLQNLILFTSSFEDKPVTFKEYVSRMKPDQKKIYFATGDTKEKIKLLPQVEAVTSHGFEVLYLTEAIDEFALMTLGVYEEKEFSNILKDDLDISTDEEKESVKNENESGKEMLDFIKESIGDVSDVRFTSSLKEHPVCLSSGGMVTMGMEKALNNMQPDENKVKAELVLEINIEHPICEKLKSLYATDKDKLADYSKLLYSQARLISGLSIDDPTEFSKLICGLML